VSITHWPFVGVTASLCALCDTDVGCCGVVCRVTVSVLTIAGTDCKLVELGAVASETGGQVSCVISSLIPREAL